MTPLILIHGGGFDRRCWDLLIPELDPPVLAVDLPGRGQHPQPPEHVTLQRCAESVVTDIAEAGFDDVVLVGHSLAGCTMPFIISMLGHRVRHAVFIACTVPPHGRSALDTLDPAVQEMVRAAEGHDQPRSMDLEMAKLVLGDDLTDEQYEWCLERTVAEEPGLIHQKVDLSPIGETPRTWILTTRDTIRSPEEQRTMAATLGSCPIVEIDAGHMCMVGQPQRLASRLHDLV